MTERDASFDAFTRARNLKASAMKSVSIMQAAPASSNTQAATAPLEDTIILAFRSEGKLWSDITTHLNERRTARKEAPMWTEAAVYSRFIIISSETATPAREVGFEPRDYANLKNVGSVREGASKAGRKRVKDFQNATELSANTRTPAVVVGTDGQGSKDTVSAKVKGKSSDKAKSRGKDEDRRKGQTEEEVVKMDGAMTELLMRAVAKVERNFWVYVADEMEREVGKYVEPKELERVFHRV